MIFIFSISEGSLLEDYLGRVRVLKHPSKVLQKIHTYYLFGLSLFRSNTLTDCGETVKCQKEREGSCDGCVLIKALDYGGESFEISDDGEDDIESEEEEEVEEVFYENQYDAGDQLELEEQE